VGKPGGRRPSRKPRCRWVNNIKMDLRETECGVMDCIHLVQDREQHSYRASNSIECWEILE
jgi:hypothetical protein